MSQTWTSYFLGYTAEDDRKRREQLEQRVLRVPQKDYVRMIQRGEIEDNTEYVNRYLMPPGEGVDYIAMPVPIYQMEKPRPSENRVLVFSWDHNSIILCGQGGNRTRQCVYPDFVERLQQYVEDVSPDIFFYAGQRVGEDHAFFIKLLASRLKRLNYEILISYYGV